MTEIKKMQLYVDRTKIPNIEKYHLTGAQTVALVQMLHDVPFPQGALYEAFAYGLAKGYRAAKAERRAMA